MGAVLLFSFQIYGDFSGYTDIAIGTARLFGIELRRNFAFPYFSRSIAEFLAPLAHIADSMVPRLRLHTPGRQPPRHRRHSPQHHHRLPCQRIPGTAPTGHSSAGAPSMPCSSCPLLLAGTSRRYKGTTVAEGRSLPSAKELALMSVTFLLVVLGRILYRAESIPAAATFFRRMATEISFATYPLPEMRTDST